MAIIASAQKTLVDLTDSYTVILTSEAYTFPGTTSAAKAGSATTQVVAMLGNETATATVAASECTCPTGIAIAANANSGSPILTVTASTSFATAGDVTIPIHIGDLTFTKKFSVAIAFTGASGANGSNGTSVTVSSTAVTYQGSVSGTTAPTGAWVSDVPSVAAGQYLWTKTVVNYSDSKSTTAYSVSRQAANGSNGASVTVSSTAVTYQVSSSGTTAPTDTWLTAIPSTSAGQYLWTRTIVTYSDNKSTTSYAVSRNGSNGSNGADAVTITIESSNGDVFKNTQIATVMTAHVYKAGAELTAAKIASLGTVKWYVNGATAVASTGVSKTVNAGDVTGRASYVATLES